MTTIAYRDGVMASDSRCSNEFDMHLTDCQKLFRLSSGAILGTAGDDDARKLMRLLAKAKVPDDLPSRKRLAKTQTNFSGLLAYPQGNVFLVGVEFIGDGAAGEWTGYISEITDSMCAVGSGQQFAYGAMEVGATAAEAVVAACRRDLASALPVWTMTLKKSKGEPFEHQIT